MLSPRKYITMKIDSHRHVDMAHPQKGFFFLSFHAGIWHWCPKASRGMGMGGGVTQLSREAADETAHQLALAQGLYWWRLQHEKCVVVLHERERNEESGGGFAGEKALEDESLMRGWQMDVERFEKGVRRSRHHTV